MAAGVEDFQHLIATDDFSASLTHVGADGTNEFTDAEFEGVVGALTILDAAPDVMPGALRLHALKRERRPWWSITPRTPADTSVRVLVRPERRGGQGFWIIGPVTRHYR